MLECEHTTLFRHGIPKKGDIVYCFRCAAEREVTGAPSEWRVRCRDCVYVRPFGLARIQAETAAAKHHNKKGHRVEVYDGRRLEHVFGSDTPIPLDNGCPF